MYLNKVWHIVYAIIINIFQRKNATKMDLKKQVAYKFFILFALCFETYNLLGKL